MNESFRVIIVGCGGMAKTWANYVKERKDAHIVGLVDLNKDQAVKFATEQDLQVKTYTNLKEAIAEAGGNLVIDTTIPEAHKNITITALEAGCNVLGEKPMASSIEDALLMLKTAEATGKSYAVMQNRRYLSKIRALRKIITDGHIGQPGFVNADFFIGAHFGGFRDVMAHPLILDMAIHTFDQARFIMGSDPLSVYCHEFNPIGSWYEGNAAAVCIFEMSDGSVFCYRGSWCSEGAPTSWESNWRISGTKGTAIWNGHEEPYCEVVIPAAERVFSNKFEKIEATPVHLNKEGHYACLDEMFQALIEGRKAETDCSDNIKSMQMVFGAIESAETGMKVKF